MMTKTKNDARVFVYCLFAALALVIPSLMWRLFQEHANRSALLVFDLMELHSLNAEEGQNRFAALMEAGISAFMVPECTAEDLVKGAVDEVTAVPAADVPDSVLRSFSYPSGTVVILKDPALAELQQEYLKRRFKSGERVAEGQTVYFRIPRPYVQLEKAGVLPDLRSMQYLSAAGVPLVFAPSPSVGSSGEGLEESLTFVCDNFSSVKVLCPTGEIAATYPDTERLGSFVKERGLLMAQVEFSRQYGAARQVAAAWPNVVSLHAVDREEVLKRNIIRPIMLNRFYRAAEEREVRLLVLRADPLRAVASQLAEYCEDVKALRARLDENGFKRLWPAPAPSSPWINSFFSAIALQILFLLLLARYVERYFDMSLLSRKRFLGVLAATAVVLGVCSLYAGILSRLGGAFAAGFLAAEASLLAMDRWKVPLRGAVEGFLLVLVGGLVIAGRFSVPLYMYRLSTFSGVKLSLLLPLLLILLIDVHKREHPESLPEILSRPPIWGEIVLAGTLLLGAAVMLLRSGNYGLVGTSEIMFRDWLEKILGARPRTKEFLIGYPALVVWYYLKRQEMWAHWREILRLAVTLAFSSAVNSFCHFHTPLPLTLLRGFNGWWIGLVLGSLVLFVGVRMGRPLFRRLRSLL